MLTTFLARHGLGSLSADSTTTDCDEAIVMLSADACAAIAGAPVGAPSPAPAVPDVVAVVLASPSEWLDDPAVEPMVTMSEKARTPVGSWWLGEWASSWSPAEHAAAVQAAREAIARGDVYQVNLVGHASAPYEGDPLPALRRVATLPGAAYPYLLSGEDWAVACASPETLVRAHRPPRGAGRPEGVMVETLPIKGTRPATPQGRAELLASTKERAEHIMIVDLERNDLARVARTGTVTVASLFAVRRWCDLWQAESRVTATLADGVDLATLLRALLPGGSVTGAPKLAALELIAALEPVGRGPSMAAIGRVGPRGLDLGLTIRTVAVSDGRVHLWAGGGITWDSDPAAEVAEAAAKAAPLKLALAGVTGLNR